MNANAGTFSYSNMGRMSTDVSFEQQHSMMDMDSDFRKGSCASETIPCQQCALDMPCPFLAAAAESSKPDVPPEESAPSQHEADDHAGDCASEAEPCAQCALHMPCPMLNKFSVMSHSHSKQEQQQQSGGSAQQSQNRNSFNFPSGQTPSETKLNSAAPAAEPARVPWLPSGRKLPSESSSPIWLSLSRRALFQRGQVTPIPKERLLLHRKKESCWIIALGRVVDATMMLRKHPAGGEIILKYAGRDCSDDCTFHSLPAQQMWDRHVIAPLAPDSASCCEQA